MLTSGPVIVIQVPERLHAAEVAEFMQELGPLFESNRPRIVFDCSQVRSVDSTGVELLLHCLEEALKRDGDLKLAALSPQADVFLEIMRVARVFEAFRTSEEAVRSFTTVRADAVEQPVPWHATAFEELGVLKQAG